MELVLHEVCRSLPAAGILLALLVLILILCTPG